MDRAHEATDKEIERLERKIKKEYKQALSDIKGKADSYLRKFEEEDKKKKAELELGYIFPNEYYAWRQSRITAGKEYEALIKNISDDLVNADKIAANIIGERIPEVYAMNGNYEAYQMCLGAGANISFDLYDRHTVEHLIDNPIFYPNVDIEKDKRWNEQKVRSAITQGILQGEALPEIANRLQQVTDMDDRAAVRNARTFMTRAENAGRLDRYKEAQDKYGLQFDKVWMATHDGRTRDTHRDIDEEQVGAEEEFSNKLQYPGDPDGDPSEVYNCRCTMRSVFVGKKSEAQEEFGKLAPDTTFEEWTEEKKTEKEERAVVEGKDITETWTRRSEFAYEIDDVINAQGFDGLPKVVKAEEFDRYVKEANDGSGFIAQRAYGAADKETLEAYRDQLYNGKWYVDCSTGGASWGQGMYCAGNTNGSMTDSIKAEMAYYSDAKYNRIETMTVARDFSAIDYKSIKPEFFFHEIENNYANDPELLKMVEEGRKQIEEGTRGNKFYREIKNTIKENYGEDSYNKIQSFYEKNCSIDAETDPGIMATLMGYDGILTHEVTPNISARVKVEESQHIVILNRTKIIIKEDG